MRTGGARLLLVGCGQLGSRHLQAIASLPHVSEIEVVDPRPEALALGQARLAEVADRNRAIAFRWLPSYEQATPEGALCIIATQANGRAALLQRVATDLDYRQFLVEKMVAQSVEEYEDLLAFARRTGVRGWVNFQGRMHPFYQRAKQRINPAEPISYTVVGGNMGLATNGVHWADMFAFYDDASEIESAGSLIDPILHPSKRGAGLFDLSGIVRGKTRKGSCLTISYANVPIYAEHYTLETPTYRFVADQVQEWAVESDAASGWQWRQVPCKWDLRVSRTTKIFVEDVLATGRCDLTTLEEGFVSHQFILRELAPQFQQLLETVRQGCPVT